MTHRYPVVAHDAGGTIGQDKAFSVTDIRIPIVIGVTGHRNLPIEDHAVLRQSLAEFFSDLRKRYPDSPFRLISGLADGADRLAAEVALEQGFRLLAALPLPQDDYEQDFDQPESLSQFRALVARAEHCLVVPLDAELASRLADRDLHYLALGRYIVRHSQIVVALWDGVSEQLAADGSRRILTGGTADVVRMCRSGLLGEHPDEITLPQETRLEHLWVRRRGQTLPAGELGRWAQENGSAAARNPAHRRDAVLESINQFNAHTRQIADEQIRQSEGYLLGSQSPAAIHSGLTGIIKLFSVADAAAGRRQIERAKAIHWVTGLGALSILCQQIYSGPDMRWGWLAGHLLLAMLAFFAYAHFFTRQNPREQQYQDWRSLAEALRVQVFWFAGGVNHAVADHYLNGDRDELDWIRQAARNATLGSQSLTDETHLLWVRSAWLQSQYDYFRKKSPQNAQKSHQFHRWTRAFFLLALALTFITFVVHLLGAPPSILTSLVLASGLCFLASALLKTYASQMAYEEQMNRYQVMAKTYHAALIRFDLHQEQQEHSKAREVLLLIGKEALQENAGWLRMNRQRKFEPPK